MNSKAADGSAGDVDYQAFGTHYADYRIPDPRLAAHILDALGSSQRILNVGAGAGSYEPTDREVVAVEPSASMRAKRPKHVSVAIDAVAEHLPFPDKSFEASMATFTVHQWADLRAGLSEMRRVTQGPVVILTCDPLEVRGFWLNDFAPEVLAAEARRYPSIPAFQNALGNTLDVRTIPIPLDCTDGFNEAYYGRPEKLLDPAARQSCSAWSFVSPETVQAYTDYLRRDLAAGTWDERYSALRRAPFYHGSLRLVVA